MKILVIENDKKLSNLIKHGLEESKLEVDLVKDAESGVQMIMQGSYNLVVIDAELPKKDGFSLVKELRARKIMIPILMLSEKSSLDDKVSALNAGCDDYMTKPFAFEELVARVNAILRRCELDRGAEIRFADLRLDPVTHKVRRKDKEIDLTAKEYQLLEFFMRNPNQVVTRTTIAESVWEDFKFDHFTNIIDVYMNYLRKKVDHGFNKNLIHTVRGMGYIFKEEE